MKIPFSWLKEFLPVKERVEQAAERLTMLGLEVDAVEKIRPNFSGVVIASVLEVTSHPNADRLVVAKVSDGKEHFQVVCGAANCRVGLKTAFAKEGAILDQNAKPFTIKAASLRGVESFGMLCSESELGLSGLSLESNGICSFAKDWPLGQDLAELLSDEVLEISLTPNLGHAYSVKGVARELAAAYGTCIEPLPRPLKKMSFLEEGEVPVGLKVEKASLCPYFCLRAVVDVQVGPSPLWLQRKLELSGIKSINNVVDAANYCQLALGQPLHTYDLDQIGSSLEVRPSKSGEQMETLDGTLCSLEGNLLVIAGAGKVHAVAGVIGSKHAQVTEGTKRVLVESAYFQPSAIRRSSKKLGISTEASRRFERGVDQESVQQSLDAAAFLIQELAQGKVSSLLEAKSVLETPKKVICRESRVEQVIGVPIPLVQMESLLLRLGFAVESKSFDCLECTVPSWRHDIDQEIDLIEEIARLYGYDRVPRIAGAYHGSTIGDSPLYTFEKKVRERLMAEGLQEIYTCSLISPKMSALLENRPIPKSSMIKVLNPTSLEQSVLRPSLLPGMLEVIRHNLAQQIKDVSSFEIGRVYFDRHDRYEEDPVLGVVLTGLKRPYHLLDKPSAVDFYDLKGVIESLLLAFGIKGVHYANQNLLDFHPGRQASLYKGDLKLGIAGEVHPRLLRSFDIEERVLFAEISINDLRKVCQSDLSFNKWPTIPGSERDWTLALNESVSFDQLLRAIDQQASSLLEKVSLIDIYRSDKLGAGKKNVTLRFLYRHPEKTLEQQTVDKEHLAIVERVSKILRLS
ncbi:MAG: pheT [Chlamydiales bacterium]|jgi:phenylalanyl-tRNA synthetase beta chain|nr:pheT [Chlamydiales bacterium]